MRHTGECSWVTYSRGCSGHQRPPEPGTSQLAGKEAGGWGWFASSNSPSRGCQDVAAIAPPAFDQGRQKAREESFGRHGRMAVCDTESVV